MNKIFQQTLYLRRYMMVNMHIKRCSSSLVMSQNINYTYGYQEVSRERDKLGIGIDIYTLLYIK